MIGTTVSHYKIVEKLGEGGMGVVYKAYDTKLDRTVALKFLPSHVGGDDEEKKRFINEAKAASALDHTNICSIYSIEETDDGDLFIVMGYYEGVSLKEKIEQGPLPFKDVINYAHQIASGLQKAHEKGVVHRDLKPANIFITNDNQVKIIDFGLAKAAQRTMLTKSGTTLGTVPYMSPEQAQGSNVDHRTDIWSLGVVMYEMITEQLPFKSEYETALVYSIINEDPEPVTGLRSGVPMDLERVINKCLEKDAGDRYQQVNEIIVDVRKVEKEISSGVRSGKLATGKKESTGDNDSPPAQRKLQPMVYVLAAILLLLMAGVFLFTTQRAVVPELDSSIAVLPFENLSPDPDDGYFAAGIHEDIIIQLARIEDIRVIGRGSVLGYEPGQRDYSVIGDDLGVSTLLEGSVHRAADRVRVSVNLIDAQTHQTVWAESYDRDMTDIFYIRTDVAQEISNALHASLSPQEEESIAEIPTHSSFAYDLYLQARDYTRRDLYNPDDFIRAIQLYERAIERDPEFSLAYAGLASAHLSMYWFTIDPSETRLKQAEYALEYAMAIDPDHPEVRMARGIFYYNGFRDYQRALDEFMYTKEMMPNNADVYFYTAAVQRRLGLWDEAKINFERAFDLDPRNIPRFYELMITYHFLREYSEAERVLEQAKLLFPESERVIEMDFTLQLRTGNIQYTKRDITDRQAGFFQYELLKLWYLYFINEYEYIVENQNMFTENVLDSQRWYYPKSMFMGHVYNALGDDESAATHFDSARVKLELIREESPEDPRIRSTLGRVYAGLGMRDEAIREGKKAMNLLPIEKDAVAGTDIEIDMAKIFAMIGENDRALEYIERLLSIPADFISPGMLRVDPDWDPLRDDPRFQEIISEG